MSTFESTFDTLDPPRYQTIARIGRGGMAEVVLAVTRSSGVVKLAVLKYLWPELSEDPEFRELFLDEARLCARLAHPNLVQTHGVLQHDGRLAMAMEYLDGQPLTRVLNRLGQARDLTVAARLGIVVSVLAGLDHAHELRDYDGTPLGLVHRDVSPHNVFVTYDGHVKLLDFGVAKTLASRHETRPGGFRGKIAYLAPEAFQGDSVDRRADIFSVGVTLWEILAGRRFWARESDSRIAWHLSQGTLLPQLPRGLGIPPELRAVCMRALARDPAERHQTAAELAADLERCGATMTAWQTHELGRLVSSAFEPERTERQALIERHLRDVTLEYASIEVSDLTEVPDLTPPRQAAAAPAPPAAAPAPAMTLRKRRGSHTFLSTAVAAGIALVAGLYLGRQAFAWPDLSPSWFARPEAVAFAAPSLTGDDPSTLAAAPPPIIERLPLLERLAPSTAASASPSRPGRRPHRSHAPPLDLLSDDVLDLDGRPLASTSLSDSTSDDR